MTIYENVATEAIASFFYHEPLWKKEILFGFLLQPFGLNVSDIIDVVTQDKLKDTIPDFTIRTAKQDIKFEVKINDTGLTEAEKKKNTRDCFLIRKKYKEDCHIPKGCHKLYWEDLFNEIDKKGAMKEFVRLAMVREYMKEPEHTLLLSPLEVAMFYSPETISAVYTMSEKLVKLCESFVNSHVADYGSTGSQNDKWSIGSGFNEKKGKRRSFFIGLTPPIPREYSFSVALELEGKKMSFEGKNCYVYDEWAYFPLNKEILARCTSEEDLQAEFNKNVEAVLNSIDEEPSS